MHIRYLGLTNFRNYARLELTLPDKPLLLYGGNAQGKTSLLEAIYLLAAGSSPLASSDRELIRWQAEAEGLPYARIRAEVSREERTIELEIGLEKRALSNGNTRLQKTIRIDRAQKRRSSLSGKLNVVLFSPQDVALVAGSPSGRRRYMDDALAQVDEEYSEAIDRYSRALAQRNAALRHVRDEGGDPGQLSPFERILASSGVLIAGRRHAFLHGLTDHVRRIHERLTGSEEWLRLDYVPNFDPATPPALKAQVGMDLQRGEKPLVDVSFDELVPIYQRALTDRRAEAIARGVTVFGPHRDEMRFVAGSPGLGTHEVDLGTYGSRGQQRTAVLSLKLAELRWMREQTGETPVLLLDEVLAELDRTRRAYLLEHVKDAQQAILTATDLEMFSAPFLRQAQLWEVRSGLVRRSGPEGEAA